MINIYRNHSLKEYNTFGIDIKTSFFFEFTKENEILAFLNDSKYKKEKKFVLGGGSNILFVSDFEGVILYPQILGIETINENNKHVYLRVATGEIWDNFVEYCINNNWAGVENLSGIPGKVGACPVQNIGAYGVEVKDVIESVEAINISTGKKEIFSNFRCKFGYRNSIFKNQFKNKYLITYIIFRLDKIHRYKVGYGQIENELKKYSEINLVNIQKTIINIRKNKLPNVETSPNAGSFFKNPIISDSKLKKLKLTFPDIVSYKVSNTKYKIAAAWLIEQCAWKGKKYKNASVHSSQPLVLINHYNATGSEIIALSEKIKKSVLEKFDIKIEIEVNVIGSSKL